MLRVVGLALYLVSSASAHAVPLQVNGHWINKEINAIPEVEGAYGGDVKGAVSTMRWYAECEPDPSEPIACSAQLSADYTFDRQGRLLRREGADKALEIHTYANPALAQIPTQVEIRTADGQQRVVEFTRSDAGDLLQRSTGPRYEFKREGNLTTLGSGFPGGARLEWRTENGYLIQHTIKQDPAIVCRGNNGFEVCPPDTLDPGFGHSYGYRSGTNRDGIDVHEVSVTTWWDSTSRTIDITQYVAASGVKLRRTIRDQISNFPPAGAIRSGYLLGGQRVPNGVRAFRFHDYAFDDAGNWTYRKKCQFDNGRKQGCKAEHRQLTYFDTSK